MKDLFIQKWTAKEYLYLKGWDEYWAVIYKYN